MKASGGMREEWYEVAGCARSDGLLEGGRWRCAVATGGARPVYVYGSVYENVSEGADHTASACSLSEYIDSMSALYRSNTTLRFTFCVGVSSPVSRVKSFARITNFLIDS